MIVSESEALAKSEGFLMINLDVRATQDRAIQSFEARSLNAMLPTTIMPRSMAIMFQGFTITKSLNNGI